MLDPLVIPLGVLTLLVCLFWYKRQSVEAAPPSPDSRLGLQLIAEGLDPIVE